MAMATSDFDLKTNAFLHWFKSLPGSTFSPSIEIVDLRWRNAGRGIVATRDIPADTTLFTIPRRGIINRETSSLRDRLPQLFLSAKVGDEHAQDPWSQLILVMIFEFLRGDSPWKPYLDVLPDRFETPMFWSDGELGELQASATRSKIGRESAEGMFRRQVLPVIRGHPEVFCSSERWGDDELVELAHRMGSTIMAYAFDLEDDGKDGEENGEREEGEGEEWVEDEHRTTLGMIPLADVLNADAEYNARVNYGDEEITVSTTRDIRAGEEVLNYYGPHPNAELLRRYGYVSEKHSRYDVVEMPWAVVEAAVVGVLGVSAECLGRARQRVEAEMDLEDVFVLEREADELNPDGTFAGPARFAGLPEDLDDQLTALLKAVRRIEPGLMPDKRKRDEARVAIALRAIDTIEAGYATSMAEDGGILAAEGLEERRRMAVVVRLGEKRLLREAREWLTAGGDEMEPSKRVRR